MQVDATHLTSLFENATEGIILTNTEGKIILVNPAARRMFGYLDGGLVGQQIEVLIPENMRSRHVNLRHGFIQQPQNRVMGHGRDLYARKKDGSSFPVEVSLSHYHRENELFVIAFIIDITFRKQIEMDMRRQQQDLEKVTSDIKKLNMDLEVKVEERTVILKEALSRLEESQKELSDALDKERELNEIKSRFVSMASHEFRTPLSTVLSSASLLGKYTKDDEQEKRDKHISRIKDSVKHLNDILEDFLSLGKLDEGKVRAQLGEFNLEQLIDDTLEEMKGLLKKGQEFIHHHAGTTIVYSDKKLVKNILFNLLSNAIKFSGEDVPVVINSRIAEDLAEITVIDKGIGISDADREHLFSSFFRGRNAVNIQGTGLGMHIVKRYLSLLEGEVDIKSRLGEGTEISIRFPIRKRENAGE
jgi:PAS domain S-box-containing protein